MHEYEVLKTTTTVKRHIQAAIRTNYYFSRITIHLFTYSTNFQKLRRKLHVYQKERPIMFIHNKIIELLKRLCFNTLYGRRKTINQNLYARYTHLHVYASLIPY